MKAGIEEIIEEHDKINPKEFLQHHSEQVQAKSQKDVFFIWMVLMFIAVFAAHFLLNALGAGPTGFATASESAAGSGTLLLGSLLVTFITILVVGIVHVGITRKDF